MKTTVDFCQFQNWFQEHRPHNFSPSGRTALFDYLEEYEEGTGENIEFDPIALCCEYSEYDDLDEFHQNYDKEEYPDLDKIRDWTQVIEIRGGGFIIQNF
tara:strand:- start:511 stop:810 length:300 start_codon:yes stop_codon:yes gene_type:complete